MASSASAVLRWSVLAFSVVIGPAAVFAAPPEAPSASIQAQPSAQSLVREALAHEALGLTQERTQLLEQAAQQDPTLPTVKWAQGLVQFQDRWTPALAVPKLLSQQTALTQYLETRGNYAQDLNGQWELAKWCEKHGLTEQARAHRAAVLSINPNHAAAREKLGFVLVGGQWVHKTDIATVKELSLQMRKDWEAWQPKIASIRDGLHSRNAQHRAAAAERLKAIDDPSAISAIELILGYDSEDLAEAAVTSLGKFDTPEASAALARLSVYSTWVIPRDSAARLLVDRPYEHFVPQMLAALYTPFELQQRVGRDASGRLIQQHVFAREGQDQQQVQFLGTQYSRIAYENGDLRFANWRVANDMARQNASAESRRALENLTTSESNERIIKVLTLTTKQSLGSDVKDWWAWWNQYNDVQASSNKYVAVRTLRREVSIVDGSPPPVRDVAIGGGRSGRVLRFSPGSFSGGAVAMSRGPGPNGTWGGGECLVAGTQVQTNAGLVAIEKVQVGDLVLAQDVDTGELAYKPVIRTTITPQGPTVRVSVGFDKHFDSTRGHLYWVSGEGWKQARELRSGMLLHGPSGVHAVSSVEQLEPAETYNLVVADFNSYFIGEEPVLCHDNTLRRPTPSTVPGDAVK